ncbi:SHOCT domain-containing protein [Natronobacterium texcoconense]|uniref:SHOCT domain-containing protein n=1 Tax=Natronobacterium texcoconense TaxID=1095778 RepID=A0A1H0ZKT6_NATTX|nr:SHOCT domain-containing protein [Natronobacterium texcoconense]SDQ27957.1 protein of unknown function [Natronobacterium texcoconense]
MTTARPNARISVPAAIVIVAVLATFVALAAIETSIAIIVAIFALIFGGEILEQLTPLLETEVDEEEASTVEDHQDALERLRTRYADGELSDAEFERRLEVLLETETVDDVEQFLASSADTAGGDREATAADGRSRERERTFDTDLE